MLLNTAYEKLYNLLIKGTEEGLTHKDYEELLMMSELSYENDLYKKYWVALMNDINYLLEDLKMDSKITSIVSPECMQYLKDNCYLFPLVLANNRGQTVRPFEEGTYILSCQFHDEDFSSLQITDYNNRYECFGCGKRGNTFSYLAEKEQLQKEREIIDLLICIYNLDYVRLNKNQYNIAMHYRRTIMSDYYKRLLEKGYTLFKANNIIYIDGNFVDKIYEDRFYTIHRMFKNERDPYFKYEPNENYKLTLSKEEYQPMIDRISNKL